MIEHVVNRRPRAAIACLSLGAGLGSGLALESALAGAGAVGASALLLWLTAPFRPRPPRRVRFDADTGLVYGYAHQPTSGRPLLVRTARPNG